MREYEFIPFMRPTKDEAERLFRDLAELPNTSPHVRACFDAWRAGRLSERDALVEMVKLLHEHAAQMEAYAKRAIEINPLPLVFSADGKPL